MDNKYQYYYQLAEKQNRCEASIFITHIQKRKLDLERKNKVVILLFRNGIYTVFSHIEN